LSSKDNSTLTVLSRWLALALALAVISTAVVPVTAQAAESNGSAWVELLEFTSLSDSGSNIFSFTTSGTMVFPLHQQMRIRRVDILISVPSGQQPSQMSVTANSQTFNLTISKISSELYRASGYVPNTTYTNLGIAVKKTTSARAVYEVLSCKVSGIGVQEFQASADVEHNGIVYAIPNAIDITAVTPDTHQSDDYQARITVYDWEKFDELTIWGSISWGTLDSLRATLGTAGLEMEVNYFQNSDGGGWTDYHLDYLPSSDYIMGNTHYTPHYGKYLFCATIDLANVDRTSSEPIYMYLTGMYDQMYGATLTVQYVNGSVFVADTTDVTWWTRFTSFFTDLFGGDTAEADAFKEDMQQQGQVVGDAAEQIDTVTRPALDDVDVDIGQFVDAAGTQQVSDLFGQLFSNNLVLNMVLVSLMVALAAFIIFGKR